MQQVIENKTFDEIQVGDVASLQFPVTEKIIQQFMEVSQDNNPAHWDNAYADRTMFKGVIAHGQLSVGFISAVLGTMLPGPGAIYMSQTAEFLAPVRPGDTIRAIVCVQEKGDKGVVILSTGCYNQDEKMVLTGTAKVKAPSEKIRVTM